MTTSTGATSFFDTQQKNTTSLLGFDVFMPLERGWPFGGSQLVEPEIRTE